MQLEFVPIEEFYFALTLAVRTLEDLGDQTLVAQVRSQLAAKYGRPSTVAAAQQNNFNYVFRVTDYDNSPSMQLLVSVADWQGRLRLGSDYGWTLDPNRKPIRSPKFSQRQEFTQALKLHLQQWLEIPLPTVG
jgi:outer membrane protein assembly factor BamE (lipoprotein component of BamABCDE complex)